MGECLTEAAKGGGGSDPSQARFINLGIEMSTLINFPFYVIQEY